MFESMKEKVNQAEAALGDVVANLDPEVLEAETAAALVERFARIERLAAAGKALVARRVAESGAWRRRGERSAAHWMAHTTGASVGDAIGVLETAARLAELPATDEAVRSGALSETQAKAIASAAAASPGAEKELIAAAGTESVAGLKGRCAAVRAAALTDEVARHDAIRARRRLRHYLDHDGAFRLDALLTPEAGAVVLAAVEGHQERIFRDARRSGRREPYEAYAADALVSIAEHAGACDSEPHRAGPRAMVHVKVDHSAFMRGEARDGETCEIPGVGPIPVATAQALASDAILAVLVTKGVDVTAVAHLGRTIPAHLRTALELRDPTCVVPGCDVSHHLEIDHIVGLTAGGETRLANLARLCRWHHYLKTHHGYGLSGGPGAWRWGPGITPGQLASGTKDGGTQARSGAENGGTKARSGTEDGGTEDGGAEDGGTKARRASGAEDGRPSPPVPHLAPVLLPLDDLLGAPHP